MLRGSSKALNADKLRTSRRLLLCCDHQNLRGKRHHNHHHHHSIFMSTAGSWHLRAVSNYSGLALALAPADFLISSPHLIFCRPRLGFPALGAHSATLMIYRLHNPTHYMAGLASFFFSNNVSYNIGLPHLFSELYRSLPVS